MKYIKTEINSNCKGKLKWSAIAARFREFSISTIDL